MSKREFELDLTSVCVGSGVVQLPLKMQALFVAGTIPARVDGEDLLLSFMEPRRLSGFKEHFERRGLRGNDKLRFEVDVTAEKVVALVAASIKRERKQPVQQGTATVEADGNGVGSAGEQSAPPQSGSSWGDSNNGSQVRAIRRVRVEGGMPLPISPAAQRFSPQPRGVGIGQTQVRASNNGATNYGGWAPLDGLSPDSEYQVPAPNDYPESTVREVRRSKVAGNRGQAEPDADLELAWTAAGTEQAVPPLYAHGFEVVDLDAKGALSTAHQASQGTVSSGARGRSVGGADAERAVPEMYERMAGEPVAVKAGVQSATPIQGSLQHTTGETPPPRIPVAANVPAPRIPVARNTAVGSNWQPTPASGLNPSEITGATRQPRLIEETDLALRFEAAYPTARQTEPRREVSPRSAHESQVQASTAPSVAPAVTTAPRAIDDAEFGGEYLPSGRSLAVALEGNNDVTGRDARTTSVGSAGEATASQALPKQDAVEAPVTQQASVPVQQQVKPVRLEDDLRMIEAYLDRPDVPAIVRSEVVAAELGIDDQRSERALERLSENRDRVSRIRKGAYMVKRSTMGQATGLR